MKLLIKVLNRKQQINFVKEENREELHFQINTILRYLKVSQIVAVDLKCHNKIMLTLFCQLIQNSLRNRINSFL